MNVCQWKSWLFTLALFVSSMRVQAGGSFYLSDIQSLLQQQPRLWRYISDTMDVEEVGVASRIGSAVNKELGGIRIAPYVIRAKPKGYKGPPMFEVVIHATTKFYDASGNVVPVDRAVDYKESFSRLELREIPRAKGKVE